MKPYIPWRYQYHVPARNNAATMKRRQKWWNYLAIFKLSFLFWVASGSSQSNSPSPSPYTSVRALDRFGQTQQLTHAREAALRGRQIFAASNGKSTVVVSQGNQPILESINLPVLLPRKDHGDTQQVIGICCSGIKGDASWLIAEVKRYVATVWDRYNHYEIASPAIAHFIAKLLGTFQKMHDDNSGWQSGVSQSAEEWARPLGIQTMILSSTVPHILALDPSGRVSRSQQVNSDCNWTVGGIGMKNPDLAKDKLSTLFAKKDDITVDQVVRKLIEALIENNPKSGESEISLEIVSGNGIKRNIIQLKNGKPTSKLSTYLE
eukprot:scaffold91_cov127-Cylindrotheca_fusiformis.AAC.23